MKAFFPYKNSNAARPSPATGAADFLRAHDKMAALLPTVARLAELQKDCAKLLPATFDTCTVLHFHSGQVTLAVPNAALAARLRQQLPKLQDGLMKMGWQVSAIRLKVQVTQSPSKSAPSKQSLLSRNAVSALADLEQALDTHPRNAALKAALAAMLARHKPPR